MFSWRKNSKNEDSALKPGDEAYLSRLREARIVTETPGANWAIYLMCMTLLAALIWASLSRVEVITRADARVVADGREQIIASLDSGILRQMFVREGMEVVEGQDLLQLDPTRVEAQQNEGQAKRLAVMATVARLKAEVSNRPLSFPPEVAAVPSIVAGETESYAARRQSLQEAIASNNRSIDLLGRELAIATNMSTRGLMSDVEVMRLKRQSNDLRLQNLERTNRFRQEASAELIRAQTELALIDEQAVVRDDALRRTVIKSPVRGLVKNIRVGTIGGVVSGGAPIMEILPMGPRVLIEARIAPADIGFVRVGQVAQVKLSAYEFNTFGGLQGKVEYISPDALSDSDRVSGKDATYYRARIAAESSTLKARGEPLPVRPGMTGTVEINTDERSVLSFLLRPMLKSREAFREQ